MKMKRQEKILEIITSRNIETQEQLLKELQKEGFNGTQATISRDIKELRIIKELTHNGTYRYAPAHSESIGTFSSRIITIFRECVTTCEAAQNLIVIKTMPGLANAACSAVETMELPSVIGTLAGDDTALIILRDAASAARLTEELEALMKH